MSSGRSQKWAQNKLRLIVMPFGKVMVHGMDIKNKWSLTPVVASQPYDVINFVRKVCSRQAGEFGGTVWTATEAGTDPYCSTILYVVLNCICIELKIQSALQRKTRDYWTWERKFALGKSIANQVGTNPCCSTILYVILNYQEAADYESESAEQLKRITE